MNDEQIQGGAILLARQIVESEIFRKPAEWFKIWVYLVCRASHKDTAKYKRGETFLHYDWICEQTGATKDQVKKCMTWLREMDMISTRRSTRGTWININKYGHFQRLDNYYYNVKAPHSAPEKHQRSTREAPRYNKNEKNEKNENIAFASGKRSQSFPKEDYNEIILTYEDLKGVKLSGSEYLPIQQAIKTMFLDGRKKEDIIALMGALNNSDLEHWQSWTIQTVKKQMPLFLYGKLNF